MSKRSATIKDVAVACGVSQTAVSLVLNNRESKISKETKERIREVAKELDYRPNQTARSLATKKTNTIGIIIPDISNAFFSESVRHIQIELNKYNYDVFLCNSDEKYENDIKYIKLLLSRNVDGIIMTVSSESMEEGNRKQLQKLLNNSNIPHVLFDRYYEGTDARVYVDNFNSGYEVVKYLIENGHKNIGLITGPLNLNSSNDRYNGALKALEEASIPFDESKVFHGKYDIETGKVGAKKLLDKVTAIFAFNDLQAYGVMETAKQQGLQIPKDLSLIGFDDIFYSKILDTRLTTVSQPLYEMSKRACELIIDLIKDPSQKQQISMKATMIKRDSVRKIV